MLNNEILASFWRINKAINKLIKQDADRLGITVVQLKAIYIIHLNPNISLGELAERLMLTNSTVSGVIERLVHNGLAERIIPQEDRRSVFIDLTEEGKAVFEQIVSSESKLVKKLNDILELPEEEISHLLRLHQIVLTKLSSEEEQES
ncbi:MarR family transcriptional regulator [Domibacillus sp. 8LH]|uniref:MarR family winged helix-turn-helix transcriptional regulator n=1 Tax=Domibacillus TaxID=1433999 RepID=UPI00203A54F6|nr:MarR family transcriptional regulator [Domibacillus indicus]MCM3789852.1 MarR family transcriptional regulator [Domibacillus indicus]